MLVTASTMSRLPADGGSRSSTVRLLAELMEEFVSGSDRSMAHVDRIEGILIEHFQDSDLFEALSPVVASYRPGGGDHLLDEEALASKFK
jgi:hypothetical protein